MNKLIFDDVKNYWNFAPFECYANCMLSLLKLWNLDADLFFLQYWFVNYDKLLLSSKHPRLNYMDYYYNLEYRFYNSHHNTIKENLDDDAAVLLYCDTKSLYYYPKDYTGGGDFGLMHFIIVYGYNADEGYFYVLDPTVDFIGTLSYGDVDKLISEIENEIIIRCKRTSRSKPNEDKIGVFKKATRQSYLLYNLVEISCGKMATERFSQDFDVCREWDEDVRDSWLNYNCVSLTSIIKNRSAIRNGLFKVDVLPPGDKQDVENLFANVIKDWTAISFLLTKFKMKKDFSITANIKTKLGLAQGDEARLLERLYEIGKAL
jgi:hypothetical protein